MNDNQQKDEQMQPAIVIHTQYSKDMSLEIPHAPEIFRELTQAPAVDVQVEVNAHHMHDNFHNVRLSYRLNGDINGKKLFILELEYAAVVALNVPEEHIKPVLMNLCSIRCMLTRNSKILRQFRLFPD